MFRKLKKHLEDSRKAQAVAAGYVVKGATMLLGFLAFLLKWNGDHLATSKQLIEGIEALFANLGNVTAAAGALLAAGVMVEDAAHKLGLPWPGQGSEDQGNEPGAPGQISGPRAPGA